jgi:hypothetical protein
MSHALCLMVYAISNIKETIYTYEICKKMYCTNVRMCLLLFQETMYLINYHKSIYTFKCKSKTFQFVINIYIFYKILYLLLPRLYLSYCHVSLFQIIDLHFLAFCMLCIQVGDEQCSNNRIDDTGYCAL